MPTVKTKNEKEKLTGKRLITQLKELEGLNKTGKARACGYVTQASNGKERVQLREFMNALIEAQGIQLDDHSSEKRGRSLSYRATVHKNGSLIIGAGYTQEMELTPGDRLEIALGRKNIKLTAIDSEPSDTEFDDFAHSNEEFDDDAIG